MPNPPARPLHLLRLRAFPFAIAAALTVPVAAQQSPTFDRASIDAYVDAAKARTLAAAAAKGLTLPPDFLAWIDADPVRRASVYGCRKDPLPVLLGLRSLEIDLGEATVRNDYPQLALAFAIQGSYAAPKKKASGWNDGDDDPTKDALPDIAPRPPLVLTIPGDPRVRVDTKDEKRALDRDDHIVNFLEDHPEIEVDVTTKELPPLEYDDKGVAKPRGKAVQVTRKVRRAVCGADVIASKALQSEFNAYMQQKGHPDVALDCGDQVVHWHSKEAVDDKGLRQRIAAAHELFHTAYRNKGRMPAERDRAPTPSESMAWFVRNDRHAFPEDVKKARQWPRFPLNAPWPVLLMLAADDQPLREREEIWTKFRDQGEFRTYGEYIGGIAQQFDMQSARRVSPFPFSYGSIQMMWKDGGVCGTMGNIGARTYRIVGVPASTAGQPGHCAIVLMEYDGKQGYHCKGGQYATGGDEVTTVHAGWNYDDRGGRRPMVFHQSVAWGMNHGFASFVDTLVLRRIWDALPEAQRQAHGVAFVRAALAQNPFALPAVEGALDGAGEPATAIAILDAFTSGVADTAAAKGHELYLSTVRDLAHRRIAALPAPTEQKAQAALLADLERQGCDDAALLARCWRDLDGEAGFTQRCVAAAEHYLAAPARTKDKKESERFAAMVREWEKGVKGKAQKRAWAEAMLRPFAGKEALKFRGKVSLDPVVAALCKAAGRQEPKIGG
jgi:hypothetical protein